MAGSLLLTCPACGSKETAERTSQPSEYEIVPHALPPIYTSAFREGADPDNVNVVVETRCTGSGAKVTIQ